jgi:hypothetical protein
MPDADGEGDGASEPLIQCAVPQNEGIAPAVVAHLLVVGPRQSVFLHERSQPARAQLPVIPAVPGGAHLPPVFERFGLRQFHLN